MIWSMEVRSFSVLQAIVLAGLAAALFVVSFSWLSIGPLGSPTAGAALVVVAIAAGLSSRRGRGAVLPLRRHLNALTVVAFSALAVVGLVLSAALGPEPTYLDEGAPSLARLALFFVLTYVAVTVALAALDDGGRRAAPFVGPIVTVAMLVVIGVLYVRAGVNPVDAYRRAVTDGSFQPVLRAVRRIHLGLDGIDHGATIRHLEVRGALCASFLGLALIRHPTIRSIRWPLAASALSASFAVLQFSRANLLILALAALGPLVLVIRRFGRLGGSLIVGTLLVGLIAVVQINAVGDAVGDGSNQSSEIRGEALSDAVGLLDDAMPFGVDRTRVPGSPIVSPHNMFLDLTLAAGVPGAIAALGLMFMAGRGVAGSVRQQFAARGLVEALPAVGLSGLFIIVIVRMFTGGGGFLDPVSWFAFAAACALAAEGVVRKTTSP